MINKLDPTTGEPLLPIGMVGGQVIWPILGATAPEGDTIEDGADPDEDPDEVNLDEDPDADPDADPDEDPEADPAPEPKKAPAKKAPAKKAAPDADQSESSLKTALNRERAARRAADAQLKALRLQNETDAERRQREADEAAEARYKPVAIRSAARAALVEANIKGDPTRAVKLINMDEIDLDDQGEVLGLDEQIQVLKTEYPELFKPEGGDPAPRPPKKAPAPKIDGGGKPPVDDTPKSSAERIAAAVLSRQG